ncbi:MAG: hypothetical protein Q8L53_04215 [Aestuariivirga sp.]|nr:hypothetical protein [Aestuariivirga sp.]
MGAFAAICKVWQASEARLHLERVEAGNYDELCSTACGRDDGRIAKLFAKLQEMRPVADDEISNLLHSAKSLREFSWENFKRIRAILQMASNALHDRKIKQAA